MHCSSYDALVIKSLQSVGDAMLTLLYCFCVGTSKAMQGLFSLLLAFESITNPALQRQLLQHSLELLEMSRGSAVRLLSHEAESAGQLMGLLREHAPKCPEDDHLLMLQGPQRDMV